MKETLINHPKLQVVRRTGSEGPKFDPYSFEELDVTTPHNTATLHFGLGDWGTINGKRLELRGFDEKEGLKFLREDFLRSITGFTLTQIERIAHRLKERCPKCGSRDFEQQDGFPGEYFIV